MKSWIIRGSGVRVHTPAWHGQNTEELRCVGTEPTGRRIKKGSMRFTSQSPKSAMTYFPAMQYHRRPGLNCCVRDGNRCGPRPMVTDKPLHTSFDERADPERIRTRQMIARSIDDRSLDQTKCENMSTRVKARGARRLVGANKPSTVSTARLRVFRPLQPRPINLVVFQGSLTTSCDQA